MIVKMAQNIQQYANYTENTYTFIENHLRRIPLPSTPKKSIPASPTSPDKFPQEDILADIHGGKN